MKQIKTLIGPFLGGGIFSCGLSLSGMTNPQKISGFLDVFGAWDPTLLVVMSGALIAHIVLNKFILKRQAPLFDIQFHMPAKKDIDTRLILGSFIFGIGWAISGLCPGPAVTTLVTGSSYVFLFFVAMIAGMFLVKLEAQLKKNL